MSILSRFVPEPRVLKRRAEGRAKLSVATLPEVVDAAVGAAAIAVDLATPFLRGIRSRWGMSQPDADRIYPGDALVPAPRWQWTHAVDIAAPREQVWPWVAQLGQDKGGFYSYQLLENLVGCDIRNADRVHPEWTQPQVGEPLRLHPRMPPLAVRDVVPNERLIAAAGLEDAPARSPSQRFVRVSWAFLLEPLPDGGTRLVSRYRCACSSDLATRLAYGPYIAEAVGFVMDRRMLLGIKERSERAGTPAERRPEVRP